MFKFNSIIKILLFLFEIIKCLGHYNTESCSNDYNIEEFLCCNGLLRKKFGDQACCGTETFSPLFNQCCNDVIRLYIYIYMYSLV